MKLINFYKVLKVLLGIGIIIKGIQFVNEAYYWFIFMDKDDDSSIINCFNVGSDPNEFLLTGIFAIVFGLNLIYSFRLSLKVLIVYVLIMPIYFLSLFVFRSIFYQNINIYFAFFTSIFSYAGMFYFSTHICNLNKFNWESQIKSSYKIAIIIGVLYSFLFFVWSV